MPESRLAQDARAKAIAELSSYIEGLPRTRELGNKEISSYRKRNFEFGWEILIEFSAGVQALRVLLDAEYPFVPPRIALADGSEFLKWPHVEEDGVLCLLAKDATISVWSPIPTLRELLADAVQLIERSTTGENSEDFEAEFQTYWCHQVDDNAKDCLSLVTLPLLEDRRVRLWKGKSIDVVGDSDIQIATWLENRHKRSYKEDKFCDAALLWLSSLPHPDQYPRRSEDVLRLLRSNRKVLQETVGEQNKTLTIILAGTSKISGTALCGVRISVPARRDVVGNEREQLTKGFRPGRVPKTILNARYLQSAEPVTRFNVRRADRTWIHGRDQDPSQSVLETATVAVVGCGALGSAVGHRLAQSGVGELLFVDPDNLSWANISRHQLGAKHVGENKATALASVLKENFPHLRFSAITRTAQSEFGLSIFAKKPKLVLNTTGNWQATVLIQMCAKEAGDGLSVVHGWMEHNAAAGHAVLLASCGCVECGFDKLGKPKFEVTKWPYWRLRQEPECGAVFEPYGANAASHSTSLITGLVLDALLETAIPPLHRIWIGPIGTLRKAGGDWSESWRNHKDFRENGSLYTEQAWSTGGNCRACNNTHA